MMSHELKTYDGRAIGITPEEERAIDRAMREGKKFVETGAGKIGMSNIAGVYKIQRTEADVDRSHQLPAGERKVVDKNSPGYKSFLAAKKRLIEKRSIQNG